ncbi:MAG: glycosyltransferase family 4 protein, partial [Arcobacter sp.]|nr:glycosyltransferase family 4 protein [Arcobacter sp.]
FKIKKKHDVILATSPPLFVGIVAYLIKIFNKTPIVFEVRDLWPESAIDTGIITNKYIIRFAFWFENFIYRKAKIINVLTPAFYRILNIKKGISENKLIMIPNAADFSISEKLFSSFDKIKFRKKNGMDGKFVITYVGAHGVANGLNQVLDTASRLRNTNVLFVLVGTGMQKIKLMQKANEMNLSNVKFFDPVPKIEVIKFILASEMGTSVLLKNDTFKTVYSNKTFDYMSCKKPILMAIDGVSRELIEKADAGIYVEPENPDDFELKIRLYLDSPSELLRQGENGYRFAKEHFDREILAKKYLEHLKSLSTN